MTVVSFYGIFCCLKAFIFLPLQLRSLFPSGHNIILSGRDPQTNIYTAAAGEITNDNETGSGVRAIFGGKRGRRWRGAGGIPGDPRNRLR